MLCTIVTKYTTNNSTLHNFKNDVKYDQLIIDATTPKTRALNLQLVRYLPNLNQILLQMNR